MALLGSVSVSNYRMDQTRGILWQERSLVQTEELSSCLLHSSPQVLDILEKEQKLLVVIPKMKEAGFSQEDGCPGITQGAVRSWLDTQAN